MVKAYLAPSVTEYVDLNTGEVVTASEAKRYHDIMEASSTSPILRKAAIESLREDTREVSGRTVPAGPRAFARFVLQFRNQRRGITPGIDNLVKWYADLVEMQPQHVRRYIPQLRKAGILAGDNLVGPLFQFSGIHAKPREHMGEDGRAAVNYWLIRQANRRNAMKHCPPQDEPGYVESPRECRQRGALRGLEKWRHQRAAALHLSIIRPSAPCPV